MYNMYLHAFIFQILIPTALNRVAIPLAIDSTKRELMLYNLHTCVISLLEVLSSFPVMIEKSSDFTYQKS